MREAETVRLRVNRGVGFFLLRKPGRERSEWEVRFRPRPRTAMTAFAFVLRACYVEAMKQVTLREANQQFSKLVREVEQTGERVLVLRNGRPAVEIGPTAKRAVRKLTDEQRRAVDAFLKAARTRPGNST